MPDLARARWAVARVEPRAGAFGDDPRQVHHGCRDAGAYVEHGRIHRREPHRRQQRRDDIGDVDEVAGLPAVAKNVDRRAAANALAEDRDHAGIGRARVLARSIHIEEAQPDGRDAVHMAGDAGMQFAAELVGAVGGERPAFGRLGDRDGGSIAVHRGGGCIDHRDPGRPHRIEHGDRAGEVGTMRPQPVGDAALHRGDGGEMKAAADASQRVAHRGRIGHVAFDQRDVQAAGSRACRWTGRPARAPHHRAPAAPRTDASR